MTVYNSSSMSHTCVCVSDGLCVCMDVHVCVHACMDATTRVHAHTHMHTRACGRALHIRVCLCGDMLCEHVTHVLGKPLVQILSFDPKIRDAEVRLTDNDFCTSIRPLLRPYQGLFSI